MKRQTNPLRRQATLSPPPAALALALALAGLLLGVPSGPAKASQVELDQPIALSLAGADLANVLQSFAVILGAEAEIADDVVGTVSVEANNTPWSEAVDRLCKEQALNCELLYGEPTRLRVRTLGAVPGFVLRPGLAQNLDIELRGAALGSLLETLPALAQSSAEVDPAVEGRFTGYLGKTPWTILMEEVCDLHGCRVDWSQEPLRVLPATEPSTRRVDLELADAPLATALASLENLPIWGPFAPVEVDGEEALFDTVSVDLENASWVEVLQALCLRPTCTWRLEYGNPSRLRIAPAEETQARSATGGWTPPPGSEGVVVDARLTLDGGGEITRSPRFTWASPLAFLHHGDLWAHLAWIPFGADDSVIAPIAIRCNADAPDHATPQLGAPLVAAPEGRQTLRLDQAQLTLAVTTTAAADAPGTGTPGVDASSAAPCREPGTGRIQTRILEENGLAIGPPVLLGLPARIGTFLLIAPPQNQARPRAAVLNLGLEAEGLRVAVIEQDPDGSIRVTETLLTAGVPSRHPLPVGASQLELEILHRP